MPEHFFKKAPFLNVTANTAGSVVDWNDAFERTFPALAKQGASIGNLFEDSGSWTRLTAQSANGQAAQIYGEPIAGSNRKVNISGWVFPSAPDHFALSILHLDDGSPQSVTQALRFGLPLLKRMSGKIAHDLNNLLAVINGSAELLSDSCTPQEPSDIQEILLATRKGSELSRKLHLLMIPRCSNPKKMDLNSFLESSIDNCRRLLLVNNPVHLNLDSSKLFIMADPDVLEILLAPILKNAEEASADATIELLTTKRSTGQDPATFPHGSAVIAIRDQGSGFTEESASRAFEPFYTTKKFCPGVGLTLASFAAEQLGGTIVIPQHGKGGLVEVHLPLLA